MNSMTWPGFFNVRENPESDEIDSEDDYELDKLVLFILIKYAYNIFQIVKIYHRIYVLCCKLLLSFIFKL